MPSLFRFLAVVGLIGVTIYGALFALANLVDPKPREMSATVAPDRYLKN